jgi:hypothetical protein
MIVRVEVLDGTLRKFSDVQSAWVDENWIFIDMVESQVRLKLDKIVGYSKEPDQQEGE